MINPDFPFVVEAEFVGPDSDHAPEIEDNDRESDDVEHCFDGETEALLRPPETVDTNSLGHDSDN